MRLPHLTSAAAEGWAGLRVIVAGLGISGFAAADALLERGAQVLAIDGRDEQARRERGIVLDTLGAEVRLGAAASPGGLPEVAGGAADLLVLSPGWPAEEPVFTAALAAGLPVWSEAELAWRMRAPQLAAPWLTVTGTRGKATTTTMLAAMLRASGFRATATGQAGTSLLEAVLHPDPYQVLAVQLSAFQLRWSESIQPAASVCLNVAGSDLDDGTAAVRGRVYRNTELACVYNLADPRTEELVRDADVIEGCRAVGFGLGVPSVSNLGLVEDVLCDRAFVPERRTSAAELGDLADVNTAGGGLLAAHTVANALAAAALARAFGAPPIAVREGLRAYRPQPHRLNRVADLAGVGYVDDSAATDEVAAAAGLAAFDGVVWVAGDGSAPERLADVVAGAVGRLRGVVLLGPAPGLREALERHAPDVPVLEVGVADTGPMQVMQAVVERAGSLARPGDTVLLSPATGAAPFRSLEERGAAFVAAVLDRALPPEQPPEPPGEGRA